MGSIYETLATLIRAGKTGDADHVKTFFENVEPIDAKMTVPQYLGRLAANATTIINAAEYGRTVYDLATRRALIVIGEDMVNTAYDSAGRPCAAGSDRGGREPSLFDSPRRTICKGFESSARALTKPSKWRTAPSSATGHFGRRRPVLPISTI